MTEEWEGPPAAHPLDGPRGKIVRAIQQTLLLTHFCEAYTASGPIELVTRFDDQAGAHLVFARGRPPPTYLGLILGEVVHDLRSGLDQLAWQLALQHTDPDVLAKRRVMTAIQFPISRSAKDFAGHRAIQYFSPEAMALIEIRQPYQNEGSSLLNPLSLVQELSNTDKHQVLRPSLGQILLDEVVLRSSVDIDIEQVEPLLPDSAVFVGDDVPMLRIPAPPDAVLLFDPPMIRVHFIHEAMGDPRLLRPDQAHALCVQIGEAIESFAPLFPPVDWPARADSWVTPDMEGTDYSADGSLLGQRFLTVPRIPN